MVVGKVVRQPFGLGGSLGPLLPINDLIFGFRI
jgi:hypothetical protein